MKFGIALPRERQFRVVDVQTADEAKAIAGLARDETDHGQVWTGLGMICHEHALFVRPQFYFSISRKLYGGPVVLYAHDMTGRTVDFDVMPSRLPLEWLGDEDATERAIQAGRVDRPRLAVGDYVHWQWPQPKPDLDAWSRKVAEITKGQSILIDGDTLIMPLDQDKKK